MPMLNTMNRKYELKKFIRLLKDAGAYSNFFKICQAIRKKHEVYDSVKYTMMREDFTPSRWLSASSFFCTWSQTKEGRPYWETLCMIWETMVADLTNKQHIFNKREILDYYRWIDNNTLRKQVKKVIEHYV